MTLPLVFHALQSIFSKYETMRYEIKYNKWEYMRHFYIFSLFLFYYTYKL